MEMNELYLLVKTGGDFKNYLRAIGKVGIPAVENTLGLGAFGGLAGYGIGSLGTSLAGPILSEADKEHIKMRLAMAGIITGTSSGLRESIGNIRLYKQLLDKGLV